MRAGLLSLTVLIGILFVVITSAQAHSAAYLPIRQRPRETPLNLIGRDKDLIRIYNSWLVPLKVYEKRSFSDVPFEDDEIFIPLMKKGRPQGPLRFGKRAGAPRGPLRFGKRSGGPSVSSFQQQRPVYRLFPDFVNGDFGI